MPKYVITVTTNLTVAYLSNIILGRAWKGNAKNNNEIRVPLCGYSIYDDLSESEKTLSNSGPFCGSWTSSRERKGHNGGLEQEISQIPKALVR